MHQRDFLLRMIEQLGQILVRLRKLIIGGGISGEEVEERLQAAARDTSVDLDMARLATPDTLVMLVSQSGEVDPSRCWLLAELLYLDALQAEQEGRSEEARASYEKALRLFCLLEPEGGVLAVWEEAAKRIPEIRAKLEATGG